MNRGFQPLSTSLRQALASLIERREPDELIVVHHATDHRGFLQLEVERRSRTLGIAFERRVLNSALSSK